MYIHCDLWTRRNISLYDRTNNCFCQEEGGPWKGSQCLVRTASFVLCIWFDTFLKI